MTSHGEERAQSAGTLFSDLELASLQLPMSPTVRTPGGRSLITKRASALRGFLNSEAAGGIALVIAASAGFVMQTRLFRPHILVC